jgi:hypothetical protein
LDELLVNDWCVRGDKWWCDNLVMHDEAV